MAAEQIAERLHARRSGSGWIAECPAHEDRSPSLSIREGNGGRTLLHCFAGCSAKSICAALGISLGDLFPIGEKPPPQRPEVVRRTERQIADLRSRLTPRERVLPVTVVFCERDGLDAGIARALALTVEGEIVQCVLAEAK